MKPGDLCHKEICHVTKSNSIHRISMVLDAVMSAGHPANSLRRRPISAIEETAERGL